MIRDHIKNKNVASEFDLRKYDHIERFFLRSPVEYGGRRPTRRLTES